MFFQDWKIVPQTILNRSYKDKTHIIIRIKTRKSPCTASAFTGIYNADIFTLFNLRKPFFYGLRNFTSVHELHLFTLVLIINSYYG